MDWVDILATVLGVVLAVGLPYIFVQWGRAKKVIKVVSAAIEDDKITATEIRAIIAAALGKS